MENQGHKLIPENKITFTVGENYKIPDNADVIVFETKRRIIVKNSLKKTDNLKRFKRVSKSVYYDKQEQEYKKYQKKYYKSEKSIQNNMRRLKILIDLNFYKNHNIIYITLTFKDNVQDIEIARENTRKFIRRLKHKFQQYEFVYIYKFERQANGSWHTHILLRDINNKKIYIQNSDISNLWGLGYTFTQTVKNKTINIDYANNNYQENGKHATEKITNYFCKTSQLFNVPNATQIYGYSKNIELPKITKTTYGEVKKVIEDIGATLNSDKTINVNINEKIINKHNKKIYTKKNGTPTNNFIN